MKEIWKPVYLEDHSETYFVSNLGRIKKISSAKERIIKPCTNKYGYSEVGLWKDRKRKSALVHHLVLWAFVGSRPSQNHVTRHLDSNRSNNNALNLAWGTQAENENDKVINGTSPCGERNGKSKLSHEDVLQIKVSALSVRELANKYQVNSSCIYKIRRGERWQSSPDFDQVVERSETRLNEARIVELTESLSGTGLRVA